MRHYEFTDPHILRAMYHYDDELLGRDMLLEGRRFFGLRFYLGVRVTRVIDLGVRVTRVIDLGVRVTRVIDLGVRVTRVIDETRGCGAGAERVWGWSYQTLQGHLEQGRLNYEVIKNLASGEVAFRVSGYSWRSTVPNPVIRWGFRIFGRWTP